MDSNRGEIGRIVEEAEKRRAKRAYKRQYKLENPERVKELQRQWHIAHKAKMTEEQIAERKAYEKQWRLDNKERLQAHRLENKERDRENNAKWRRDNKEYLYTYYRQKNMRVKYGLTEAEWEAKFEKQGRCCAICKATEPNGKNWHTDHCKITGMVRGILCSDCNHTVRNHSPQRLRDCANYVEMWLVFHSN